MKTLEETIREEGIQVVLVSYETTINTLGEEDGRNAYGELVLFGGANAIIDANGQKIVQIIDDLAAFLGPDRLEALVAHEVAHLVYGHRLTDGCSSGQMLANLQHELEADAYAAAMFDKQVVADFIRGALRWGERAALAANNSVLHDAFKARHTDPVIISRFEALR